MKTTETVAESQAQELHTHGSAQTRAIYAS